MGWRRFMARLRRFPKSLAGCRSSGRRWTSSAVNRLDSGDIPMDRLSTSWLKGSWLIRAPSRRRTSPRQTPGRQIYISGSLRRTINSVLSPTPVCFGFRNALTIVFVEGHRGTRHRRRFLIERTQAWRTASRSNSLDDLLWDLVRGRLGPD